MATDATGTPTAKGIPKFNTSVDAPSGLGTNAMMDSIDTLLDSYVGTPAGIVTGEAAVWNGSAWVRSSVTKLGLGSLAQGGAGTGDKLEWNGSAWAPAAGGAATGYGTALPGSPADGEEFILVDSTTAPTRQWRFRYNNGSSSSYKWEFIGGTPLRTPMNAGGNVNSTIYVEIGTALTVPNAGVYNVTLHVARISGNAPPSGMSTLCGIKINAANPSDSDTIRGTVNDGSGAQDIAGGAITLSEVTFAASDTVVPAHRNTSGGGAYGGANDVTLLLQPIRVS